MNADFRRIALSASIAIVATILVAMSARAIFPTGDRPTCEPFPRTLESPTSEQTAQQIQRDEECRQQLEAFDAKERAVAKNQFFVLMGASLILLIIGGFVYTVPVVSSGILWGGVISLFYTLMQSFRPGIEDYYRLLAAIVAFVLLIALAYRLFGKERAEIRRGK